MNAQEIIKEILLRFNINAKVLSERLGYDRPQVIYDIQKGKTRGISGTLASKIISVFPQISKSWLLTGEGEMLNPVAGGSEASEEVKNVNPEKSYTVGRPYYNVDFLAGFDLTVDDQTAVPDYLISFPPYDRPGVLWCNVSGHSMEPEISNGDIIALSEVLNWRDFLVLGDVYAIITTEGLRTVKRLRRGPSPDSYTLQPANPAYDPQPIRADQIARVYRVLTAVKRF